ncbi:CHAP domain-containing protein [Muricomes intestini]|uniref:CHAP domain-containing protein n=1 Tax=Muricomes intestini TaxID=1796634 RepID=A0A4V2URT6_9FIRM|nr:lysozyme family protein [Muricomes intestini]TCS78892.1 CHAP domain-containing protein [Muricomes intestini]
MADIKTRETVKGTIKTLDKAAIAGQKMKQAYIATKDKAEHSVNTNENTAEEYAADKTEAGIDEIAHKGAYAFDKAGRKGVQETKQNIQSAKEGIQRFKQQRAEKAMNAQKTQGRPTTVGSSSAQTQTTSAIRTLEKPEKMVKQSATSAGKKNIKLAGKEAAKTTQRSVKTAENTAKASIKTSQQTAKAAQKTAQATVKASQKAAQAAKKAAKATADTVKATAKATVATVKAIIAGTKALVAAIAAGGWIAVLIIMIVVLFGAAVAMFGGGSDSNSYTPVSAEVEAYEPIIQKYAKEYGIPEYVELIKAVMMQESGGRGLDPMQAAEGSFNTKYPHEPNGIKDPEYSIQCGVQELKAALTSAEVESPIDMEHIKLALQGYNFGNGYISWAKTKYGGYSYANAVEFSTQQAQRLGWDSYGDTQYPAHVLRYYPYGRAFTAGGNQAIVEVALTQVGNQGGQPYWSWYGFNSRVEWCACFVSWCADQCGYIESGLVPKFAGCVDGANWFKSNGKWQNRTYEPKAGDIIFFDWEGDGTTDHVGIVEKCENGTVYTVEGNSGDACKQRQYAVGSSNIYGYGIPAY